MRDLGLKELVLKYVQGPLASRRGKGRHQDYQIFLYYTSLQRPQQLPASRTPKGYQLSGCPKDTGFQNAQTLSASSMPKTNSSQNAQRLPASWTPKGYQLPERLKATSFQNAQKWTTSRTHKGCRLPAHSKTASFHNTQRFPFERCFQTARGW